MTLNLHTTEHENHVTNYRININKSQLTITISFRGHSGPNDHHLMFKSVVF